MSAAVILAGGRSSRMGGGEKALLEIGGKTLLAHAIARLQPQTEALAINANRELDRYRSYGLPVISDEIAEYPGPLAGILAAMRWAAGLGQSHVITVAGDTPFFPISLAADLAAPGTPIAMATTPDPERGTNRHPVFARWSSALADDLAAALASGTRKILAFTDSFETATISYPTEPFDPFFNVNTPEDLAAAAALAKTHQIV